LNPHVKDNKLIASTGGGVISFVKCPKERFVGAVYCIMWSLAVTWPISSLTERRPAVKQAIIGHWLLAVSFVIKIVIIITIIIIIYQPTSNIFISFHSQFQSVR
jgi:hypothetical protein